MLPAALLLEDDERISSFENRCMTAVRVLAEPRTVFPLSEMTPRRSGGAGPTGQHQQQSGGSR